MLNAAGAMLLEAGTEGDRGEDAGTGAEAEGGWDELAAESGGATAAGADGWGTSAAVDACVRVGMTGDDISI